MKARELTYDETTYAGEKLAWALGIGKNRQGRYKTNWGDKTAAGLYLTITEMQKKYTGHAKNSSLPHLVASRVAQKEARS